MAKKKNKSAAAGTVAAGEGATSSPPDPNIPDLPSPAVTTNITKTLVIQETAAPKAKLPSQNHHHDHDHHHHHSHYARSIGSEGGTTTTKIIEEKTETVVKDKDPGHGHGKETKTIEEVTKTIVARPPSPAPSARSVSSHAHRGDHHHHPEVVVNVTVPPAVAQALAPPPATIALPATLQLPTSIPLPLSVPPSPAASVRSMRLPIIRSSSPKVGLVQAIPEENEGDVIETKVVTTTTTVKRAATPPRETPVPSARISTIALPPPIVAPSTPLVVSHPIHLPSTVSRTPTPPARDQDTSPVFERTTVETISYPVKNKSKFKFPKFNLTGGSGKESTAGVDTSATTIGNPTTRGEGGARTRALGSDVNAGRIEGTKAGLRPIPIIDYRALIASPPRKKTPQLVPAPSPPAPTIAPSSPGPKTILTMSAEVDRDSRGNEHVHAVVRDHSGVKKVDRVIDEPPHHVHHHKHHTPKHRGKTVIGLDVDGDGEPDVIATVEEVHKETKRERKEREKRERKEERERRKEPLYRRVDGMLPPPMSDRYAAPPNLDQIQNAARERYQRRFQPPGYPMMSMGMPGVPGQYNTGWGGPPYPPPPPMTYPRPPPLMASRPPMFGGSIPPYPMPQMGLPMENSMMGMGMGSMGYGMGMPAWNGVEYGFMGNPRFR